MDQNRNTKNIGNSEFDILGQRQSQESKEEAEEDLMKGKKREAQSTPSSNGCHCNLCVPINLQLIVVLSLWSKRGHRRGGGGGGQLLQVKQRDRKRTFLFCMGQVCWDHCGPQCGLHWGVFWLTAAFVLGLDSISLSLNT